MSDVGGEQVQVELVQICEGQWRTRAGDIRNVTPTPECDNRHHRFPWRDTAYDQTWAVDGRYNFNGEDSPLDLIRYLGPIERQPEPVPESQAEPEPQAEPQAEPELQPVQVKIREGRWKTRGGDIRNVTPTPAGDGREHRFPWWDAQYRQTWAEDGRYHVRGESPLDLVKCLGPIEPEPQPEPEHLQAIIAAQAETIARLQSEAHELNMEIGGLQGDLSRRQARIRDLETMHAEAAQAVVRADKANDKLRAQADELRSEVSHVQRLLGESRQRVTHLEELVTSLRTINEAQEKSFNAANKANDDLQHRLNVVSAEWAEQTERFRQLQQANDRLAQLEVLQPIAAACHTAQTMVRDMLGHMRCLLALQHTTDRRDSCTLLESILEVFDDAECDEDEDEDTTNTSEAGQS